jgi:hypothetical protein
VALDTLAGFFVALLLRMTAKLRIIESPEAISIENEPA